MVATGMYVVCCFRDDVSVYVACDQSLISEFGRVDRETCHKFEDIQQVTRVPCSLSPKYQLEHHGMHAQVRSCV